MEAQGHKYMKPKFPSPVLNRLVSEFNIYSAAMEFVF